MGITNKHLIRHKAKGYGKKWRPSPNDPILAERPPRPSTTVWVDSVRDLFKR